MMRTYVARYVRANATHLLTYRPPRAEHYRCSGGKQEVFHDVRRRDLKTESRDLNLFSFAP
jgi:hypothetical protein